MKDLEEVCIKREYKLPTTKTQDLGDLEEVNSFTHTIIKQIIKKDDDFTREVITKYVQEKYPKEHVKLDFLDEDIINEIIDLGLQEYLKKIELEN